MNWDSGTTEELLHRGHDRADVDEGVGVALSISG
jgi:hypothetical protein